MTRSSRALAAGEKLTRILPALAVLLVLLQATAHATEPAMHAGALAHSLDRLGQTGRVLYVAAHPDDENTRLLAYLAGERHLTVAYLSLTRGGGGQNLIGPEQGELLDVIRTRELLAARWLDGAVQRFSRMRDFGYSKSADETFSKWGKEEALADVVRVIRTFQPDAIVARFSELPPNHGHHTASAILAREAFAAAADPSRFPEQLAGGVTVWKTDRLLYNVASWPGAPAPPAGALELDVGGHDVRLGLGWGELAAQSRSQHKSQGFGVQGERGKILERFVPVAGTRPEQDPFQGLARGWASLGPGGQAVDRQVAAARRALDRDDPSRALPGLVKLHAALGKLPATPRVTDARRSLEQLLLVSAGAFVRATAERPVAVPGGSAKITVEVVRRGGELGLRSVALPGASPQLVGAKLGPGEKRLVSLEVTLPADAPISTPYWLATAPLPGRFPVRDQALIGAPVGPPALTATVTLELPGLVLELPVPVVHAFTDPVHGERVRDFLVVPPATVTPTRAALLSPDGAPAPLLLRVRAGKDGLTGEVSPGLPAGWSASPAVLPVALAKAGDEVTLRFELRPAAGARAAELSPVVKVEGREWSFREDVIDYPHLPVQLVLQPASCRVVPLSLKLPGGLIGYVRGSGDTVAEDLAHAGARVELVPDDVLRSGELSRFSAIVLGIRAYNVRPAVRAAHERLLRFVEQGGTLVVQYNTQSRLSPLDGPIGPFPLELGRDRITDETAAMTPVDPREPLLAGPNRIEPADFDGWVQERGIYYAARWDPKYRPLFRSADPGEAELLGGTLVADHGKGRYVYTGLAFFRQLPAGVPGAYRLLANLLSRKGP